MHKQRLAMAVCGGLGIIATFLPWVSFMGISASGLSAGIAGILNLALFGGGIALAALGDREQAQEGGMMYGALACFGLGGLYGIFNIAQTGGMTGFGLYLVVIAGIGGAVAAFVLKGKGGETV